MSWEVNENDSFDDQDDRPLVAGWHAMEIRWAEEKMTKKGDGKMVVVTLEKMDSNRRVWDYIIVEHPSPKAVSMGRKRLRALGVATGVMPLNPDTLDDLFRKQVQAQITVNPPRDGYGANNSVRDYRPHREPPKADPPFASAKGDGEGTQRDDTSSLDDSLPF